MPCAKGRAAPGDILGIRELSEERWERMEPQFGDEMLSGSGRS